ncbi:MAG: DUF3617 domain-containing protein [Methyloligellaceae bacterium]
MHRSGDQTSFTLAICISAIGICFLFASPLSARELRPGLYEIEVSVELPHLTNPAATQKVSMCITDAQSAGHATFQILSEMPIAKCPTSPISFGGGKAEFRVICPGKRAAHALAKFSISTDAFDGTIRMNMGGKNMTVIERQKGKRIGTCGEK